MKQIHKKVPKPFKRTDPKELNAFILYTDGATFADEYMDRFVVLTISAIPNPYRKGSEFFKRFQQGVESVYVHRIKGVERVYAY